MNRTLVELTNAMLIESCAPLSFGGEALLTACYVLNSVPHKNTKLMPLELWKGYKPNLGYLRVWGCLAYMRLMDTKISKLGKKITTCAFLGYASNSTAYRFFNLEDSVMIESGNAIFHKDKFPFDFKNRGGHGIKENILSLPSSSTSTLNNKENNDFELGRNKRARVEKDFGPNYYVFNVGDDPIALKKLCHHMMLFFWKEAVNDEMELLISNKTWKLVDLPPGCKTIGYKWVLYEKLKPDDSVDKYKVRLVAKGFKQLEGLVAKGFKQLEGLEFFNTFSPVTRITSIRLLVGIDAIFDLQIHQMDVKTTF
ncbi:uncharacterized protein LOC107874754 isoform X1 [Capsicum annuum]|uniref:uncharacterized protein LOC107874754 isoform X1 n=1 Tax=Capsicum annuum TaxID=4072 RepID=UPI001FB0F573|nr:uncharacterized protein LOC107874754 isoform X1 [Capsicum annuum]XP_047269772.1 uncharacterized protein LOC107874754 isoform X1 [Capsicum annuum]